MISLECMDAPPDFLQGQTFSLERPSHSKLTLPCKHGFGALNLMCASPSPCVPDPAWADP